MIIREKDTRPISVTCDQCAASVFETELDDFDAAKQAFREAGWTARKGPFGLWENICPDCSLDQVQCDFTCER